MLSPGPLVCGMRLTLVNLFRTLCRVPWVDPVLPTGSSVLVPMISVPPVARPRPRLPLWVPKARPCVSKNPLRVLWKCR